MKRFSMLIFVMVSVSLSFALDLVGGISYNTYNFDFFSNDGLISLFSEEINKSMENGWGGYAGVGLGGNIGIEIGADLFNSKYESPADQQPVISVAQSTFGPYAALKVKANAPLLPISLDLKAAVAYYSNETTSKGEISWGPLTGTADLSGLKFKGLGYLIGGGLNLNITRSLNLSFNGTYRIAKLPLTEVKNIEGAYEAYEGEEKVVVDLSGLRIGAGLSLEF